MASKILAQYNWGVPDIKNYPRQVYHAGSQNWGIAQDQRGMMYFGNNDGLLSFDGYRWRVYPLPDKKNVRSLDVKDDCIFIGGQEEIGFFKPGEIGDMQYHSLRKKIPYESRSDFADVWNVVSTEKSVFFRSNRRIFLYENDKIKSFKGFNWSFLGKLGHTVYAFDDGIGLMRYDGKRWVLVLNKASFPKNVQISNLLPVGNTIWIVTLTNGIFKWIGSKSQSFLTPDLAILQHGYIYGAITLQPDQIALLTNLEGCAILDTSGRLLSKISRREGLQNNNIISGFLDRNRNLWLGLGNGIDMVAISKPIYNLYPDEEDPISGYASAVLGNNLYLGTTTGVYKASYLPGKGILPVYQLLESTKGQIWNLTALDKKLFIGQYKKAMVYDGVNMEEINHLQTGFWNFQRIPYTNKIVAGTYNGVHFFSASNEVIHDLDREALFESAKYVIVDSNTVWAMHPYKGLYKISLDKDNLPSGVEKMTGNFLSSGHNHLFQLGKKIIVCSDNGIFELNHANNRFERSLLTTQIRGLHNPDFIVENAREDIWFSENGKLAFCKKYKDSYTITYFSELDGRLQFNENQHIFLLNDTCAIVASERGFFYVNAGKYLSKSVANTLLIRSLQIQTPTKDSMVYGGYLSKSIEMPKILYQDNSVSFSFSVPNYGYGNAVTYSYTLEGLDTYWSNWTEKAEKSYTNLQPGIYHFHVRSKIGNDDKTLQQVTYDFEILAPWYRTTIAYIIYFLLFLLTAVSSLRYVYHRYDEKQAKKIKLQRDDFERKRKELEWTHMLDQEQQERKLALLHSEKLEIQLNMQNATIANNAMTLIQKGELLNRVRKELTDIAEEKKNGSPPSQIKKIIKIVDQEINNKEDWEQFAQHFNKVHENFMRRIKETFPSLSSGDLKLCALLKLGMTSKEISGVLNVSLKAVEIGRYRLRKKLNLQTEDNLFDFLSQFG